MTYEELAKTLEEIPMTWVPALLALLIKRCRQEPIFKGYMALQMFISRAWRTAVK